MPQKGKQVSRRHARKEPATLALPPAPLLESLSLKLRKIAVSAFVLFHLVAIVGWSMPKKPDAVRGLNRLTAGYLRWTGLWQGWNMFAPDPRKSSVRVDAVVTFDDGVVTRQALVPASRGLVSDLRQQRYRKWAHDNLRETKNKPLWRPAAEYAARLAAAEYDAHPVRIELVRHWKPIPAPDRATVEPAEWKEYTFYCWQERGDCL